MSYAWPRDFYFHESVYNYSQYILEVCLDFRYVKKQLDVSGKNSICLLMRLLL
jgi:hypothetical protein